MAVDFGGCPFPLLQWGPPADHMFVDQAAPWMASMVQFFGPDNVYIISSAGRRHYKQHIIWLAFCRDTGLPRDHCKFIHQKTGPGAKGEHAVRLKITEFMDDQLVVLQNVQRAFFAIGRTPTLVANAPGVPFW